MKKVLLLATIILFAIALTGCQNRQQTNKENQIQKPDQPELQNQVNNPPEELKAWKTFENEEMGYEIKYPPGWFVVKDACCPPYPTLAFLNNYSATSAEHAAHQMDQGVYSMEISCLYEGKIEDIGELQGRDKDEKKQLLKVNNLNAVKFSSDQIPGDSSQQIITYYIVNGEKGCRLTFSSDCPSCDNIIQSFQFK